MNWVLSTALLGSVCFAAAADTPEERFETKVRPILAKNCFACHTASKMGGLALTSRESVLAGGKSGPAVVSGKPDESRLILAVRQGDAVIKAMPMTGKLKPDEIAALEEWVRDGAVWPASAKVQAATGQITPEQRAFWSFQPVRKGTPPAVANSEWSRQPVDQFIYAKLRERGLQPAPRAARATWLRRVTFDLTGLPPTPEETDAYLNDKSSQAEAKVVDRLLASPRYGERWARHWLDVARYSDDRLESQKELPHPNAFRYRDWVIAAFNNDMPYSEFVLGQIAADLLPEPQRTKLLPGLTFYGLSPEQQDERVDATTRGFLGLTVACAQCHDHKFDPIPQTDFYALQGVFNSTVVDEVPLAPEAEVAAWKAHKKRLDDKEAELRSFQDEQAMIVAAMLAAQTKDYVAAVAGTRNPDGLDPETLKRWREYLDLAKQHDHPYLDNPRDGEKLQTTVLALLAEKKEIDQKNLIRLGGSDARGDLSGTELLSLDRAKYRFYNELFGARKSVLHFAGKDLDRWLGALHLRHLAALRAGAEELKKTLPPQYPFLHAVKDSDKPKNANLLIRGSRDNPGAEVPRRFVSILSPAAPKPYTQGSGRLELARAIASIENPLTPRVMVNRIWQHHFGQGIVRTPSNFGQLGERPTHPELLDYLAARFVESGWSVKAIHREIVLSRAYASAWARSAANEEKDAANLYLWRANRQRLDVETMRDALLAAGGNLEQAGGGPPLRLTDDKNFRRTVYGYRSRRKLDGTLALFDHPNPNTTNEQRNVTNVPLQRLYFLNNPFVMRQGAALAARLNGPTDEARIRQAYRLLFARQPDAAELRAGLAFLKSEKDAWPRYAQALLASNEFLYVD
ncbi:MAG: PSD1 domain-containing protein [Bryobacterales bacterium]|nr:PSD1 domain-containing protein [Bryobacterales bacterium]